MPPEADGPQVLIAGAGPVGLTLAHELTRRRVRVRVIDRADGPATTSRALAVHPRTLEACHQMGLADALVARGRPVVHFTVHLRGRQLIRFDTNYGRLPTAYPFSLMLDQVRTEEILRERLAGLGVGIEWGVELADCAPCGDRVNAELRRDGRSEQVTVPWLVGADGSRSTVRERLGLRLVGDATQTWLNADVVLDADLSRDSNHLVHTGSGTVLLVPFPDPGKWRAVDTGYAGQGADPETVRRRLAGSLARGLGRPVAVSEPTWVSVFRVQQRMITAMRSGRCFVAGDAAHVHSPASGQGMNTGMQDAYNLAWKLADVVRGHAREELLDTYAAERIPVGGRLLSSTRTATALVALRNAVAPVAMPVGLSFLKAVRPLKRRVEHRIMAGMSGLALHYADSPLTYGTGDGAAGVHPGHLVACTEQDVARHPGLRALRQALTDPRWLLLLFADDGGAAELALRYGRAVQIRTVIPHEDEDGPALADPDDALRQTLGVPPGGWALIRPDGYLAAKGQRSGTTTLTARLQALHLLPEDTAPGAGDSAGRPAPDGTRRGVTTE
ncbi:MULTISPECIES: FAD-dependent monooxygenase [Streptomyces]|uniref:6-methylpretetramide 4-monooxygenase n=3 Tax=Streptomyces rimosus TaxID=1927 RepID=OXYL_STRRM|nr:MULTISPECIES: FAD-dependent monooxygenase [Streptomyces]Q3S8Q4.1 RecName: Full=6-methylpretetramide 4-monooxygenase; AltName: Full=4-hydroxy-6-methylpretetramide 12a-monooxygenase [Streptomyces rimosus]MYT45472.1 NAD(P)-binding protein [Streptomyces sp. SID5471]AAZ78335.1 OxyL [Streptomyces rimosus]QDA02810.1 oxygenase [Streptomyces rimosus]QEV74080.1 oxygenase [Streptomyces rimosus]QGY68760.1 NAD(P)-binding protein [Streptomyces rimosus R6-500]